MTPGDPNGRPVHYRRAAVFLDRDGVLNAAILDPAGRPLPPRSRGEFRIPDDVPQACAALKAAGFAIICITNQPDIARGSADVDFVEWVNGEVQRVCDLDALYVCPHDDADGCDCRKPKPGMIHRGEREFGIDLVHSFMVGDRYRDIEAGQAAGVRTVFLDFSYPERSPMRPADFTTDSFTAAVAWILRTAGPESNAVSSFPRMIAQEPTP
jgi:D-glycero-D-manno-heptose 1,7-bisphosphate phosphatase